MLKALLAIQCSNDAGETGTFMFKRGAHGGRIMMSPLFDNCCQVFAWATENGWTFNGRDPEHPVGSFTKE